MERSNLECVDGQWQYTRSWHQRQIAAQVALADAYGCKQCLLTPSGTAAIAIAVESLILTGNVANVAMPTEMYGGTEKLLRALCGAHRIEWTTFDPRHVPAAFDTSTLVVAETVSNPSGWRLDLDAMAAADPDFLVLDNTWATHHLVTIPWSDNVFAVLSLAKHYSGGQTILGAVLGNDLSVANAFAHVRGNHVDPDACTIVSETLPLLPLRRAVAAQAAQTAAVHVAALGMELDYCPGSTVLVFLAPCSYNQAVKRMKTSGVDYKTSYGARAARFDTFPVRHTTGATWCRLALGYEDNSAVTRDMLYSFTV